LPRHLRDRSAANGLGKYLDRRMAHELHRQSEDLLIVIEKRAAATMQSLTAAADTRRTAPPRAETTEIIFLRVGDEHVSAASR
jgi:hypothetical protein